MSDNEKVDTNEPSIQASTGGVKRKSFKKVVKSVETVFEDPTKEKSVRKGHIVWKAFKCIVFLICLSYLISQSAEFYKHYYTYPTNINFRVAFYSKFKLPGITTCYRNRISAKEFCEMHPNLCENPKDTKEYCLKHSELCPENTSDLVIPRHGYYTNFSKEVSQVSQQLLFNRSDPPPVMNIQRYRPPTVTFVQEGSGRYLKCFTDNFLLYREKTRYIYKRADSEEFGVSEICRYNLSLHDEESFDARGRPQAFFAVHPPTNPINPVHQGYAITSGNTYAVEVKLEEEHLLPQPYASNCENYNLKPKKNYGTEPRSQEICMELCKSEFLKQCSGCNGGLTMYFTIENMCPEKREEGCPHSSLNATELTAKLQTCLKGCKPDCLKLKYPYTLVKTENVPDPETGFKNKNATIVIYVKDPDVKIMSYDPLYAQGELFSYIGGLVGCWLGISVWASTSIFEKFILKVAVMKRNYRLKKEQSSASAKEN